MQGKYLGPNTITCRFFDTLWTLLDKLGEMQERLNGSDIYTGLMDEIDVDYMTAK